MKKYILLLILISLGLGLHAQSYKIIVNNSNSTTTITTKDVSDLFLKKQSKWSNGTKVMAVDLNSSSDVRKSFSKDIHGKSVGAIKSYWQQYVFAGKGTPPVEKKSDSEVVNYVKNNSGAIGYVSADASTDGVKVIQVN